ncbi:unnamed protein product, partial [Ixodes hexagonus]
GGPRGRGDGGNRGRGPRRGSGGGGYHEGNRSRTESSGSAGSDRDGGGGGGGGGDEDQRDQPRDYQDNWQHREHRQDHRQDHHRGSDRFGGGRPNQDGYVPYQRGEHRGEDSYRRPQRRGGRGGMPYRRGSFDGDMRGGRGGRGGYRGQDRGRGGPPRRGRGGGGGERRGRDFPRGDADRREDRWERRDKTDVQQGPCTETWDTADASGVEKGQGWGTPGPAGLGHEDTGWGTSDGAEDRKEDVDDGQEEVVEGSAGVGSEHEDGDGPEGSAPKDVEEESEDHLDPCNDTSSCPESSYLSGHSDLEEHDDDVVKRAEEESLETTYRESMKLLETMHDPVAEADRGDSDLKDGNVDHPAASLDSGSASTPDEPEVNGGGVRSHACGDDDPGAIEDEDAEDVQEVAPCDLLEDVSLLPKGKTNLIERLDADKPPRGSDVPTADSSCVEDFTDSADVFLSQESDISDLNDTTHSENATERLVLETEPTVADATSLVTQSEDADVTLSKGTEQEKDDAAGLSPHINQCSENGVIADSELENGETQPDVSRVQAEHDVGLTELPQVSQDTEGEDKTGDALTTVKGKDAGVKAIPKDVPDDSIGTAVGPEFQKE